MQTDIVLRYLQWLDATGVLARTHNGLVRALVCHRFLTLAGVKSTLLIGFDGEIGHSWVEVDGEAIFETQWAMDRYRPILAAHPGCRTLVRTKVVEKNS
ncbi:MAG: lasso peptide biosynthesis B2 protein [Anaerolineales bacterium]|nr:lasso peptide biosynthesis B2 protein [Anaerolineales bacterium]